ncbi:MAG: DUF4268 domain-containing protein [Bacteroidales bacterium]|nr:DUF4268 domain-containing protein [Bacteroidales bacterium]MCR5696597.1 DUF4268 domain-containing protein [Marinilabiliaceae bacterium]
MYTKEEAQLMRHEFWHKMESKTRRLPGQKGKPKKWISDRTGVRGLDLRFDVNRDFAMVAMEISRRAEEHAAALWTKMESCKKLFESHFEAPVIWDFNYVKEAGDVVGRIYVRTEGNIYDREKWSDMIHFLIDNMIRLEDAFSELKDYLENF